MNASNSGLNKFSERLFFDGGDQTDELVDKHVKMVQDLQQSFAKVNCEFMDSHDLYYEMVASNAETFPIISRVFDLPEFRFLGVYNGASWAAEKEVIPALVDFCENEITIKQCREYLSALFEAYKKANHEELLCETIIRNDEEMEYEF